MNRRFGVWLLFVVAWLGMQGGGVCQTAAESPQPVVAEAKPEAVSSSEAAVVPTVNPLKKEAEDLVFPKMRSEAATPDGILSLLFYMGVLLTLGLVALYLVKNGWPMGGWGKAPQRKLKVADMRPLGNRQFLVVVEYENTKLLIGVSPGRIDYLHDLSIREPITEDFATILDRPSQPAKNV